MATSTLPAILPNSGSGYMRLQCGVLIQWGVATVTVNTNASRYFSKKGSATVTFPIAFETTPHVTVCAYERAAWWNACCNGATTTSFNVHLAGDSTGTKKVFWLAIGLPA